MTTFTANQELSARSICDNNCIFRATVVKRTAKTITIKDDQGERRCKIHNYGDGEFIFPFGQYSMAAIFRA